MALFLNKWGDIRGKVGDLVFSVNAAGAYIRSKVTPLNPFTAKQVAARARLGQLAQEFAFTLTEPQRKAWENLAAQQPYTNVFGEKKNMNGLALYVSINSRLLLTNSTTLLDAPLNLEARPVVLTVNAAPTTDDPFFEVNILPTLSATEKALFYYTPAIRPSINFVKNLYRYSFVAAPSFPNPIQAEIDPTITPMVVGQKVAGLCVRQNLTNGGTSLPVPFEGIITVAP
jgi:hypothetical protein